MSKRLVAMFVAMTVGVLQPAIGPALQAQRPLEGIKVHGHWAIDVRQPDGTLVTHTEFENALTPDGAQGLALLLSKRATVLNWQVEFLPFMNESPWGGYSDAFGTYNILAVLSESASGYIPPAQITGFETLTVTSVGSTVLLKGTAIAQRAGRLEGVHTLLRVSPYPQGSPNPYKIFSSANMPNLVALVAEQTVEVTVTFSFS